MFFPDVRTLVSNPFEILGGMGHAHRRYVGQERENSKKPEIYSVTIPSHPSNRPLHEHWRWCVQIFGRAGTMDGERAGKTGSYVGASTSRRGAYHGPLPHFGARREVGVWHP
jgi:hypothetical protein